jgi:hypothetical protein
MDRILPITYSGKFKNGIQPLKYSIPSIVPFKFKAPPAKFNQLVSRLVIVPIEKASCNPKRIVVILSDDQKYIGYTFDLEDGFSEAKVLDFLGYRKASEGSFVVLEN